MTWSRSRLPAARRRRAPLVATLAVLAGGPLIAAALPGTASAAPRSHPAVLIPGNLLISGSDYSGTAGLLQPGVTVLPPGCTTGCAVANADGTYPQVFNNVLVDPAFGVTSPIFIDQVTPAGRLISHLQVPDGTSTAPGGSGDRLVTSFSSKSELALNLSTSKRYLTFMGYVARPNQIDVSNSNTPAVIDPTNPDLAPPTYRAVAQMDLLGQASFTETNAYSGNNGRAAILNDTGGADKLYTAGNAGNGSSPQPDGIIEGAGAQIMTPKGTPERVQDPGAPTPVGAFSVAQLGLPIDKVGKDTNFRGLTIFNNVLYYSKDSGSNGINTVYFVDTTGKACPSGVGVPQPGARLPAAPLAFDPSVLQTEGLSPQNMCILSGFPTALKSKTAFPADLWFANSHTLYVADEGNGDTTFSTKSGTYSKAAAQTTAGLQKWVLDGGTWKLAYTLQSGLNLGVPYTVAGYPAGDNAATGLPWAPANDGLRNITGRVNADGTVTVWAVTATVSGAGDTGADPNAVVAITDKMAATSPAGESFTTTRGPAFGQVLRGVSLTPGS